MAARAEGNRNGRGAAVWIAAALLLLLLAAAPFAVYAFGFGYRGLTTDLSGQSRLFAAEGAVSNLAMALHMAAGGAVTLLALSQLAPILRRRAPRLHRIGGYAFALCAVAASVAGLLYIALRGTIGGPLMSGAFALYGALLLICSLQAVRFARARRFETHRRWALRAAVLGLGSWIYRAHYTIWHIAAGGLGSKPDFSGLFYQIQLFAFYLPYLAALEIWFAQRRSQESAAVR